MATDGDHAHAGGGAERAPLIEIFHSIQGEGRFVGQGMAFVRVATCPIRCHYCDTRHSYVAPRRFPVRIATTAAAGGPVPDEPNPVNAARAAELVRACAAASPFAESGAPLRVSVTGGEPLVFPRFVLALGAALGSGALLHLETAALAPQALGEALPAIAHLSADYKLPATLADGADHGEAHAACVALALAAERPPSVDVKIVLPGDHDPAEYAIALDRLAPFRDRVLLCLQPVTPVREKVVPLPRALLESRARDATRRGFRILVVPQLHPLLGID
ncbi:MAG: 7-carboxy-7-deazaguanine synthase QueE [Planctomycetes bacterium]|nr:7-carboxy-7-deazaguanine synthase QueE [Planctomycetota bacterium]